jgi:protein-L-isoaspartate(D-aspartate) O-methyltransferase
MCIQESKIKLIMHLRQAGIRDINVLNAIEAIPRESFIPPLFHSRAYDDAALPIGLGQTISQPLVVATMTQALKIEPRHKVLEIGTGSGYQAAILSQLCRRVYSLERHRPLLEIADRRFRDMKLHNITTMTGDGMKGWPHLAPFDRIIVTAAAASDVPRDLIDQLSTGGVMIMPLEDKTGAQQTLMRYTKVNEDTIRSENIGPVKFVPLLPNVARETLRLEADMNQLLAW